MSANDTLRKFSEPLTKLIVDSLTLDDLRQTLMFQLGMKLGDIVDQHMPFNTIAFDTVQWAIQKGQMRDLARAIAAFLPGRPDAKALAHEMEAALAERTADSDHAGPPDQLLREFNKHRLDWDHWRGTNEIPTGRSILEAVETVLETIRNSIMRDISRESTREIETVMTRISEVKCRPMFRNGGQSEWEFWKDGDELLDTASRSLEYFRSHVSSAQISG